MQSNSIKGKITFMVMLVIITLQAAFVQGQIYVSQAGAGSQNGTSAGNAYSIGWLTNATALQIPPGSVVKLESAWNEGFAIPAVVQGAANNPITFLFDSGCYFRAGVFADPALQYAAIFAPSNNFITVDLGGSYITATNSGSALGNIYGGAGIVFFGGAGITIQNGAISNLFVRAQGDTNALATLPAIWFSGIGMYNLTVSNVVMHDECVGLAVSFGGGMTNVTMEDCTIFNVNWGGSASDTGSGSHLNGLTLLNNHIFSWANWDDPADVYHHNGFYGFLVNGGTMTNVLVAGNTIGPGYGADNTSGIFFSGPIGSVLVRSNVFLATDGTAPANGLCSIGLGGSGSFNNTAVIINNTFLGSAQNGTAIFLSGGLGSAQTLYSFTNNLFQSVAYAVWDTYHGSAAMLGDYNLYYSLPAEAWSISNDGDPNNLSYAVWTGFGFDAHGQTTSPNLINLVPTPPSAAIGTGFLGYDIGALPHNPGTTYYFIQP